MDQGTKQFVLWMLCFGGLIVFFSIITEPEGAGRRIGGFFGGITKSYNDAVNGVAETKN